MTPMTPFSGERQRDKTTTEVHPVLLASVRGRRIAVERTDPLSVVLLALLALEDPRVDGVLSACGVRVVDTEGHVVFPMEAP